VLLRKIGVISVVFTLCLMSDVWANRGAPANPGSALIIYNGHRSSGDQRWDHSIISMEIFRAALSENASLMTSFTPPFRQPYTDIIPPFVNDAGQPSPERRLLNVNTLDVRGLGIDNYLRTKFYGRGRNAVIDGQPFDGDLFDELYDAGNPLSYWSQVYDLRYIQERWIASDVIMSVITTEGARSDLAYFRAFMRDGGGIYIQSAYGLYVERNNSLRDVVRALTLDRNFVGVSQNSNILMGTGTSEPTAGWTGPIAEFWFNNSPQSGQFATDFNNLTALQASHPMKWIRSGGIDLTSSENQNAIPLVNAVFPGNTRDSSIIILWDSTGLDPEVKNGLLIVGFCVNAWTDHRGPGDPLSLPYQTGQGNGVITRTTMAVIQNLYAQLSKTQRYTITKRFVEEERAVDDTGTVVISVHNPNNFAFSLSDGITDELHCRLRFVSGSDRHFLVDRDGNRTPTAAVLTQTGQTLRWVLNGDIPARSHWAIEFQYIVNPPCQ